jgi:hypothetical protein
VDYLVFSPTLKNILLFFNYKNIEKKERKKERQREREKEIIKLCEYRRR